VEFWQVVAGRTISGLGGAGMNVLVSILITGILNLFPKSLNLLLIVFRSGPKD
jgi:hypothetical protein